MLLVPSGASGPASVAQAALPAVSPTASQSPQSCCQTLARWSSSASTRLAATKRIRTAMANERQSTAASDDLLRLESAKSGQSAGATAGQRSVSTAANVLTRSQLPQVGNLRHSRLAACATLPTTSRCTGSPPDAAIISPMCASYTGTPSPNPAAVSFVLLTEGSS